MSSRYSAREELLGTRFEWWGDTRHDKRDLVAQDFEYRQSENNGFRWYKNDDVGGVFKKYQDLTIAVPTASLAIESGNGFSGYDGKLLARRLSDVPEPYGDGTQWGGIAFNRMKPTKPMFNLANFAWELRELPSAIHQLEVGFERSLKGAGDFFLSQVFGWIPVVSETLRFVENQQRIQKRIEWLLRNNGKWISRKVQLSENTDTIDDSDWIDDWSAFRELFVSSCYHSSPQSRFVLSKKEKLWATAQFRYFLPKPIPGVAINRTLHKALNGFHGIRLYQLYKAVPWSWLVDWSLNLATVLENADAGVADSLAARRFFIMGEQTITGRLEARCAFNTPGSGGGSTLAFAYTERNRSLKTRVRGSPFYPGNPQELSPMQWAILGALGLSKY